MHEEENHTLAMSKESEILSNLVANAHQPLIEGKTPQET